MKRIYSFISLAVLGTLAFLPKANAQITLTSADMPAIGAKIVMAHDTTTSTLSKLTSGASGASATWNISSLPTKYTDTTAFVSTASTPYASFFPTANLADSVYGTAGYTYFNGTASSFLVIGSEQNFQGYMVPIVFTPAINDLNFTTHYGDVNSGITTATIAPIAVSYLIYDSARAVIHATYADTIDSWGTITTPWYGPYNVLRQKNYEVDIDSLFIHSSTTKTWSFFQAQITKTRQYTWYANGIGDILVTMTMDTANKKVTGVSWYHGTPDAINELSQQHNTRVYPNPCSSQVNFLYSAQSTMNIYVYDITGRQISQTEMLNGTASLNTSDYSNGMYLYRITDKSGNVLDNGKFTVQK
jgi:hypothetical protein